MHVKLSNNTSILSNSAVTMFYLGNCTITVHLFLNSLVIQLLLSKTAKTSISLNKVKVCQICN